MNGSSSTKPRLDQGKATAKKMDSQLNATNAEATASSIGGASKNERRATRLRAARPDIASKVGKSIALQSALSLGGFADPEELEKVLMATENQKRQQRKVDERTLRRSRQ